MRKRNSRYYKSNKLIQCSFSFPSPLFSCPPVLKSQEWDESSLKALVYLASNAINVMYEVPQDHSDVCSNIFRSCEVPVAILYFFHFYVTHFAATHWCLYNIFIASTVYYTDTSLPLTHLLLAEFWEFVVSAVTPPCLKQSLQLL